MLEIENLTKTFGTQTVISDISMTLVSGKIYGLVGRNGSGKTVLMKMILGFIKYKNRRKGFRKRYKYARSNWCNYRESRILARVFRI